MRPRDAAAWLAAGQLDGAFISTDTAMEHSVDEWPAVPLGFTRSDLVVACRDDAPASSGPTIWMGRPSPPTSPRSPGGGPTVSGSTSRWWPWPARSKGCARPGWPTRSSTSARRVRAWRRTACDVLATLRSCEATFSHRAAPEPAVADLLLRLGAALGARQMHYLVMHIDKSSLPRLRQLFPGLVAPTVLPLEGHDDLVAAHLVVDRAALWAGLGELRELGASGIVAVPTHAIVA